MKLSKFLPSALFLGILTVVLAVSGARQSTAQSKTLIATPPNFLVAFIGDQGLGSSARSVLELIRNEGANMVIVQGDLGYNEGDSTAPTRWGTMVTEILGSNFPLFASRGNHDVGHWTQYRQVLQARLNAVTGETCTGDIGVQSTCSFSGLTFTSTYGRADATYLRNQHTNSDSLWTLCSWHHNQQAMQVGGKSDEVGWGPYEACREAGAIVATAHEHSYHRTKTLTNMQAQTVSPTASQPNALHVAPGETFAFVSGLGGASIRDQERCLPSSSPYGCKGEWANIYTSTQSAQYGALFIHFNVDGNPRKAHGYFKNIAGQIVDEFTITNDKPGTVAGEQTTSNTPPTIALEPAATRFTVAIGQTLRFAASAVDLDGDTLSLEALNLADFPGATFTLLPAGTPTPTPTPTPRPSVSPSASPTRTPSLSPTPTSTSSPSPTPSPLPTPTPSPGDLSSPFGIYPNCIAPAIGFETHSWWHQKGEKQPRHVHLATCLPNARANDGGGIIVHGTLPAVFRVMAFNNPGHINWTRYAWESDVIQYHNFNPRLQCQSKPDELKECTWYVPMNIDTSRMHVSGLDELRLSPNVQHDDLNTRQFATNNYQLHRGGSSNYRSSPAFIARSWYTGTSYANVQWNNYLDFFRTPSATMPTVSGVITLNVKHDNCSGESRSHGFVDPNFHAVQRGEKSAPTPFYEKSGCFGGNVQLDTRTLTNGIHGIYLQTQESNEQGQNSGAGFYQVKVQN